MNGKRFIRIFFRSGISNNLKSKNALQAVSHRKDLSKIARTERISECIFGKKIGSLTVEAALVISIFLITAWSLLTTFTFFQLQVEIEQALADFGKEIGDGMYQKVSLTEAEKLAIKVYLGQKMNMRLSKEPASKILEGNVSLLGSKIMEKNSEISLKASYKVDLALAMPGIGRFKVSQSQLVRGWNGFLKSENEKDMDIVYMTTYGEVYHSTVSCRHLKRTITPVSGAEVEYKRSESGEKYYPCEYCHPKGTAIFYITSDGNRYHKSLNCQGLIRNIFAIPKSEVGHTPACSICGG